MRKVGRFDSGEPRGETRGTAKLPKPDFARSSMTATELHAYYIAVVSSRVLRITPDLKPK